MTPVDTLRAALAPHTPLPWQLAAVEAYAATGGLFCAQSPGSGKTAVAAVCARLTVGRTLVLAPAAACKALRGMFEAYGADVQVESLTKLSRHEGLLRSVSPKLLIVDESQGLKNVKDSAWGRRIARHLSQHPGCQVVCLSGSIMHRSALDYMPQLVWALRGRAPCPGTWAGMQRRAAEASTDPEAWVVALKATPGVFIDAAPSWAGELRFTTETLTPADDSPYTRAVVMGEAPDGWAVKGFARDELLRQLSFGWYYARSPRPSPALVEARNTWQSCVQRAKTYGQADTAELARTHYPKAWAAYQAAVEAEPEGEPVATWLGPELTLWLDRFRPEPGTIVWVDHPPLGEAVAQALGVPYHRHAARDTNGVRLDEATAPVVVASIGACHASLNCQQFRHNVVLEPPTDARVWQQLIARTARQGQKSDCVTVHVVLASPTYAADYATARKLAAAIERETAQKQALLRGKEP